MKTFNRITAILLSISMALTIWAVSPGEAAHASTLDYVPDGYVGIYTPEDLQNLSDGKDAKYILMKDLDMSAYAESGWAPAGTLFSPFRGLLDGNGHTIANLRLAQPNRSNTTQPSLGLFAYVDGGTIKNLTIQATVDCLVTDYATLAFGVVAGRATGITLENCSVDVTGSVRNDISSQIINAGGLVGQNDTVFYRGFPESDNPVKTLTMTNCRVSGAITGTAYMLNIGGLAGFARDAVVQSCTNDANIQCLLNQRGDYAYASGILGSAAGYQLSAVTNNGTISTASEGEDGPNTYCALAGILCSYPNTAKESQYENLPKTVTDTVNKATVEAGTYSSTAAGILLASGSIPEGDAGTQIVRCANLGNILVPNNFYGQAAGITNSSVGTIRECYNAGDVLAQETAAGIALTNAVGEIQESYNIGTIQSAGTSAGIAYINLDLIENCYNAGYVRGAQASGLAFYNSSYALILTSYNTGGVECTAQAAAGIAGQNEAVVWDTYYYENTSIGITENEETGIDDSEKLYTDDLFTEESYAGFDFGEPVIESVPSLRAGSLSMVSGATTGVWKMSGNTGMPALNATAEIYVQSITVAAKPFKYYYLVNESVNTAGLVLKVTMSDGSVLYVNKGFALKPYSKTIGTRNITVVYNGKTAVFPVNFSTFTAPASGYTSSKVAWNGVTGATSYKIYRATSATGTYQLIYTASASSRSYINTGLTTGKTYYYKIRPMYKTTYGALSSAKSIRIVPGTPSARVEPGAWIRWNSIGGSYYEIWRATSLAGPYTHIKSVTAAEYLAPAMAASDTYYYKIRAYHIENGVKVLGAFSNPVWLIN